MILHVCPECKDVISDGELRGNNKTCRACNMRRDRSDLIEIDTARVVEEKLKFAQPELSSVEAGLYGLNNPNLNKLHSSLRGGYEKQLGLGGMQESEVPVLESLDALPLILGASWDEHSSWGCDRTLVIKAQGSKSILFFALIWLGITVPLFGIFLFSMILDPSSITVNHRPGKSSDMWFILVFAFVFWGVGLGTLYWGIMSCLSKTWIDINHSSIGIERGLKRRGNVKWVKRTPNTSVTMDSNARVNNVSMYAVYVSDGEQVKVASGLVYDKACEMVFMLKTILAAQI